MKPYPQALEIERAVLGTLLLESQSQEHIGKLKKEMFYNNDNARVFEVMQDYFVKGKNIDILTVSEKLQGLAGYITGLTQNVCGSIHLGEHIGIVIQKYIQRQIITKCSELTEKQYLNDDIEESLSELEGLNSELNGVISSGYSLKNYFELIEESKALAEERISNRQNNVRSNIPIPFSKLNETIGGWQKEDLIYIAARPGMGKTAVSIVLAREAAKSGKKVFFFSLEMSDVAITDRALLGETSINPDNWKLGKINNAELNEVDKIAQLNSNLGFYIIDKSSMKASEIQSLCRKERPDMIFIDYIQLMRPEKDQQNRNYELGGISHKLKEIAKELKIPVVAMAQLSREVEKRSDKRPVLADLRDSGELEQDADIVIFLYRPAMYEEGQSNVIEMIISKHRNGRTGVTTIQHNDYMNKFYDMVDEQTPPF